MNYKQERFNIVLQCELSKKDPAEPDKVFFDRVVTLANAAERAASIFLGEKRDRRHAE